MGEPTASRTVVVANPQGLHLRPADVLARAAGRFSAKVELVRVSDGQRVDAKSILQIVTMAAEQGTELRVEAVGQDAQEAMDTLVNLMESDFALNETRDQDPSGGGDDRGGRP